MVKNFGSPSGEEYSVMEPISSYATYQSRVGSVIVGNRVGPAEHRGMFSVCGKNIHTLGRGVGWGNVECTKCIDAKSDTGTSFATPEVATKMFIAKAYWRKFSKRPVNSLEARMRLIMATDLRPCFVGKFASGGSIDFNKLLCTDAAYLVTNSDSIIDVDTIYRAHLNYDETESVVKFETNKNVRAIYRIDSSFYIIQPDSGVWKKDEQLDDLLLHVHFKNGNRQTITRRDFIEQYRQFVRLD